MPLLCECDYCPEPGDTIMEDITDYITLSTARSRKCYSCGVKIAVGDLCSEVPRFKIPSSDIELKIYGEEGEIRIAPKHMCERCSDIYNSLTELGFCGQPWEDQRELLKEYQEWKANGYI